MDLKKIIGLVLTTNLALAEITIAPAIENSQIKSALETKKTWQSDTIVLYKNVNYAPLWIKEHKLSKAGTIALEVLKTADKEGLNPKDYEAAEKAIKEFSNDKISPEEADTILTNEFIRFINDVRVGRVPPSSTARTIKIKSPKTDPVKLLQTALEDSSNDYELLRKMAPPLKLYEELRTLLAEYKKLATEHPTLPEIKNDKLKVGSKGKDVANLRVILNVLGDYKDKSDSEEFDKGLEDALKSFQERHTITADGVVGVATRKALNMPLQERINKIIINLERLRWLPDDLGSRYIMVNVGGFEVTAVHNDTVDLRIKAIVGKQSTRTPLFYAPVKNVIINPSWGVPAGIMQRDKLPKIINDPSYVRRSGFTVYDSSGNVIDPEQADWEGNGMSYRLRQSPGGHNALGRVKLNIENPYTIYLHGTPEEKLFNNAVRAFSSGCIRLQKPIDLASWVLKNSGEWSVDKINASIKSGGTKTVPLKEPIEVYFSYQTVWVDDKGVAHFSNDVYNLDGSLIKLITQTDELTFNNTDRKMKIGLG